MTIALSIKAHSLSHTNDRTTDLSSISDKTINPNIINGTITNLRSTALLTTRDTSSNTISLRSTSRISHKATTRAISSSKTIHRRTMGIVEIRATGMTRADIDRMMGIGRIKGTRVVMVRGMGKIRAIEEVQFESGGKGSAEGL